MPLEELRAKIKDYASREARTAGNPYQRDVDRELADAGRKRQPADIPKQDVSTRRGLAPGNVTETVKPTTDEISGVYRLGAATRPAIRHDSGFSAFPKRESTLSDYMTLYRWKVMLASASTLRPDLADATAAYRHFLEGNGVERTFSYERYVNNDESGRRTLRCALLDAQIAATSLWRANGEPHSFSFSGPAIPCGSTSKQHSYIRTAFPYPATENWQKAIGAHVIWLSGFVSVLRTSKGDPKPEFSMQLTLHAEDQYNFNPGQSDIASGIPDDENGQLVVCKLAHGFRHVAKLRRSVTWRGFELGVSQASAPLHIRQGRPRDSR